MASRRDGREWRVPLPTIRVGSLSAGPRDLARPAPGSMSARTGASGRAHAMETAIMNPAVVARTVELVRERIKALAPTASASRAALLAETELNETKIKNLVGFLAKGGAVERRGRRAAPARIEAASCRR